MLTPDKKTAQIISLLVPNHQDFHIFEEAEAQRNLRSRANKARLREFKKLQNIQISKNNKIIKQKLKEKEEKLKRREEKALAKQIEEHERMHRNKNRRK